MGLVLKINEDLKSAMKNKDKDRLSVIRMLKSAIQLAKIDLGHELNDDEVVSVISKQIKMRKDSITEFSKAGRDDLVSQYQNEVEILNTYMPEALSLEEVNNIIDSVFNEVRPEGMRQMGIIMKEVSSKVKGRYDMSEISKMIKDRLNNL